MWVLGDQLLEPHPAVVMAEAAVGRARTCIVFVESAARLRRLPYHRKKQVLLLSAMRHHARALEAAGHRVEYLRAPDYVSGLREHVARRRPASLLTMAASGWEARRFQQGRLGAALGVPVELVPSAQFLLDRLPERPAAPADGRTVMEPFYRRMRRSFGVLLDSDGGPEGGRWSYDPLNRRPLPRNNQPPEPAAFSPDALTREVIRQVDAAAWGVGTTAGFDLPVTRADAHAALGDFVQNRLAGFGDYEDAMTARSGTVYHSRLATLLNLGLLDPLEAVRAVEAAWGDRRAPLNAVEGFVRQVIGWREYLAWQYWRLMPGLREANAWGAGRPMPRFFWDGRTDMRCLETALGRVLATGYAHHIERLMLFSNFLLLAGVGPPAAVDWFMTFFVDAYDWVMQPNVVGMGLNADGGKIATKPYVASAAYVNRMSDYCAGCRFDPKQRIGDRACPFNALYWAFLDTHERRLRQNPRLGPAVLGLRRLDARERRALRRQATHFLDGLDWGPPPGSGAAQAGE